MLDKDECGRYTSLAVDSNGNLHISYFNDTSNSLIYRTNLGGFWTSQVVDGGAVTVGLYTSIAVDSQNKVHISYYDFTNHQLKYANNVNGNWNIEFVDSGNGNDVGRFTSIAIDSNGKAHISYADSSTDTLKYAENVGGTWALTTVATSFFRASDGVGSSGVGWTSIALDSLGNSYISYDGPNNLLSPQYLYYATNNGGSWITCVVDSASYTGQYSSLAIDKQNNIYISYYGNSKLNLATIVGSSIVHSIIDAAVNSGSFNSIAVDQNGRIHINYYDSTNNDLKYIAGLAGSWSSPVIVDSGDNVGMFSSIGVSSQGRVFISYYDATVKGVKCAGLISPPSAPSNLNIVGRNGQTILTWQLPSDNGGNPVTNYTIYRGTASGSESLLAVLGNVLTYTDSGLTNALPYYYKISASNIAGEGTVSSEVSAIPSTVPAVPQNLNGVAGNHLVTLSWNAPTDNGGSTITGYNLYRSASSGDETLFVSLGNVLTYTDSTATNGQPHYYKISAINANGEGALGGEIAVTPQATIPGAPSGLTAIPNSHQLLISWNAPTDNGGSTITGYILYYGTVAGVYPGKVSSTSTSYLLTSLTNGQPNYFVVSAINVKGESVKSSETSSTPADVPGPPINLQATATTTYVDLSWSAPSSNGGSLITGYSIFRGSASNGEGSIAINSVGASVITYRDNLISNGATYYYYVKATNTIGNSVASLDTSANVPSVAPSAPLGVTGTGQDKGAVIIWNTPSSTGGSQITGYRIYLGTPSGAMNLIAMVGPSVTAYTCTNLNDGQTYFVKVTAVNAIGEGDQSAVTSFIVPQSDNATLVILILASLFAIVALLVVVIVIRKRRGKN